jgi:DNA-binding IscR family transcriptional regulator
LDWLAHHRWRALSDEEITEGLQLRPAQLRWALHSLRRWGLIESVRSADGATVGWQVLRNALRDELQQ